MPQRIMLASLTLIGALWGLLALPRLQPLGVLPAPLAALLPDWTCEPLCLMGVQLGQTTPQEAEQILAAHVWVKSVWQEDAGGGFRRVAWNWNDSGAAWVSSTSHGQALYDQRGVITSMVIPLRLQSGAARTLLGEPSSTHLNVKLSTMNTSYPPLAYFYDNYGDGHLLVRYGGACPLRSALARWNAAVLIEGYAESQRTSLATMPTPPKHGSYIYLCMR